MERAEASFIPNSRFDRIELCTNSVELIDLCDESVEKTNEFIFQMKPGNFPTILHYYLGASKLHFSDGTCPIKFSQVSFMFYFEDLNLIIVIKELKFWGISTLHLETCCMKKYLDIQVLGSDINLPIRTAQQ